MNRRRRWNRVFDLSASKSDSMKSVDLDADWTLADELGDPEEEELEFDERPKKKAKSSKKAGSKKKSMKKGAVVVPSVRNVNAGACFSLNSRVRLATAGYSYKHWFNEHEYYPPGLRKSGGHDFAFYAEEFDSLEINATHYAVPASSTVDNWVARVPRKSFQYIPKVWKELTHIKKLNFDEQLRACWSDWWNAVQTFSDNMGPLLFQFPPTFKFTSKTWPTSPAERLDELATLVPKNVRCVFEFRDPSWFCEEVYDILRKHNWCLCVVTLKNGPAKDKNGNEDPKRKWAGSMKDGTWPRDRNDWVTCDWGVYFRYHGSTGQYKGEHGEKLLREHVEFAKSVLPPSAVMTNSSSSSCGVSSSGSSDSSSSSSSSSSSTWSISSSSSSLSIGDQGDSKAVDRADTDVTMAVAETSTSLSVSSSSSPSSSSSSSSSAAPMEFKQYSLASLAASPSPFSSSSSSSSAAQPAAVSAAAVPARDPDSPPLAAMIRSKSGAKAKAKKKATKKKTKLLKTAPSKPQVKEAYFVFNNTDSNTPPDCIRDARTTAGLLREYELFGERFGIWICGGI